MGLCKSCEHLDNSFMFLTGGASTVVDRAYQSCLVTVHGCDTLVDLLMLDMDDFKVILGMNWLAVCHMILDFHTKTI